MRKLFIIMVWVLLSIGRANGGYITQALLDKVASSAPDELVRINIVMNRQSDISHLQELKEGKSASVCYLQDWSPPVRVSPDGVNAHSPELAVDHDGRVWCAWNGFFEQGIYVAHYEGDAWSDLDTAVADTIYMVGGIDIAVDTMNCIWIVTSDDFHNFVVFYDGNEWSDTIIVPGFPACNFGPQCAADSLGNLWVFWGTDYFGPWRIYGRYYNAEGWSDTIRASVNRGVDSRLGSVIIDKHNNIWVLFIGDYHTSDSLHVHFYNGNEWSDLMTVAGRNWASTYQLIVGGDICASEDSTIWSSFWVATNNPQSQDESVWVYTSKYSEHNWTEPFLVQTMGGQVPYGWSWVKIAGEKGNEAWLVWSVRVDDEYYVYYSIYEENEWLPPTMVDTLSGRLPAIVYDPYRDRIWVAWESQREGYPAVYVSYTQATGIEENRSINSALGFFQNTPNPFCEITRIRYQIFNPTKIRLRIYNIDGQLVRTLIDEKEVIPGQYMVMWDGRNNKEKEVPNGVYFLRLETEGVFKTRKMVFIR